MPSFELIENVNVIIQASTQQYLVEVSSMIIYHVIYGHFW